MMMKDFLNDYSRFLSVQKGLSPASVSAYMSDLSAYFEQFDVVDRASVDAYFKALHDRQLASTSVARQLTSLKQFAAYLYDEQLIDEDVASSLRSVKLSKRLPAVLTEAEVSRLLFSIQDGDAYPKRDKAILGLMYGSGLRVSEIISVCLTDIIDNDFLKISGKGNKERMVPMSYFSLELINDYLTHERPQLVRKAKPEPNLFLSKLGKGLTRQTVFSMIKAIGKRAGLSVSPHMLRHSIATHMLNKNSNIRDLQEFLGHASIASTQIYTHVSLDKDREIFNKAHPRS